jgi:pimeloyl-ACP methyl ester carboxylesterase
MWRGQLNLLVQAGFRCIVPDLRGHGESFEPGEKTDIEAHLKDVLDTLADLDLKTPAVFAGHSLGAIISMHLAERHPEMISKILAISMPGRVPRLTQEAFRWFMGWPYHSLKDSGLHQHLDWRSREMVATNEHALEQIMANFTGIDYATNVPKVVCPVHFAVGRLDPVAPYIYCEQMHKALPNSTCTIIEWAGHNCMDSRPETFNRWLTEKIKE